MKCSACNIDGHLRPTCPRVYTCRRRTRPIRSFVETHALRESMLERLHPRRPMSPVRLFAALRDEWGSLGERRLWRVLCWLTGVGLVARDGRKYQPDGYVRRCV